MAYAIVHTVTLTEKGKNRHSKLKYCVKQSLSCSTSFSLVTTLLNKVLAFLKYCAIFPRASLLSVWEDDSPAILKESIKRYECFAKAIAYFPIRLTVKLLDR